MVQNANSLNSRCSSTKWRLHAVHVEIRPERHYIVNH